MDAKELAIVVVGLLGTYCLPWPAVELAAEERLYFAAAAKRKRIGTRAACAGATQRPQLGAGCIARATGPPNKGTFDCPHARAGHPSTARVEAPCSLTRRNYGASVWGQNAAGAARAPSMRPLRRRSWELRSRPLVPG